MTILSTNSRMSYTGAGNASNYSFTFKIFNEEDLLLTVRHPTTGVETELTITTDYTVTIGSSGTGSIDLVDASQAWLTGGFLTTAWILVIRRVVELKQETDIRNQGAFFPENHEDAFDYMTMISQQLKDEVDRSLKIAETDSPLTLKLPTSTERASQFLAFDADGEPIASAAVSEYPVSSYMQTVLDDTTAADARTTLGFTGTGGTAATANIENNAVTYAKIQNVSATDKLLGRSTSGAGNVEEIACTAAGRALLDDAAASDQRTTLGLDTMATQAASNVAITGGSVATQETAKAWVNFNGTGTVAIRDSFNVSSITDNNPGDYTVNFTSALPNANYVAQLTGSWENAGDECAVTVQSYGSAPTTTAFRITNGISGTAGSTALTPTDSTYVHAVFFGD